MSPTAARRWISTLSICVNGIVEKLRELAGIPLLPDSIKFDGEPTILRGPPPAEAATEDGEVGIVPTGRSILSLSGAVDQGDQKLGGLLR